MQVFQQRYDGTDTVAAFIQQTLQLAGYLLPRLQEQARGRSSNSNHSETGSRASSRCSSWSELFVESPKLYLRLLFALDYAISRGYFPSHGEVQRGLGGEDIDFHLKENGTGEPETVSMPVCSSEGFSGLGITEPTSSPYMDLASGSGLGGQMAMNLTNVYTLLDSEQQQQSLNISSAEPYTAPDYERQVFDPLVLPPYNPMLDSEYAYPGHVPFTHQNYAYGMYQQHENGGPDILHLGSSSSESYSDTVAFPVAVWEEECVNG